MFYSIQNQQIRKHTRGTRRRTPARALILAVVAGMAAAGAARADVAVTLSGTMNIYGAGHAVAPGPGGAGGGMLPFEVAIPAGTGRTVQLNLTGVVDYGGCCASNGPDGIAKTNAVVHPQYGGLAGCDVPSRGRFVVGVFLDDTEPADPPPDSLYIADVTFSSLSPSLRQMFFVGDGLTGEGSGSAQAFHVPDTATRLFLGYTDRCSVSPNLPGWYSDNSGTVSGTASFWASTGIGDDPGRGFRLGENYPNPFRRSTTVTFNAESAGVFDLSVYDVAGRRVRNLVRDSRDAGPHSISWDGRDASGARVSPGIYFYRLQGPEGAASRRMLLLP